MFVSYIVPLCEICTMTSKTCMSLTSFYVKDTRAESQLKSCTKRSYACHSTFMILLQQFYMISLEHCLSLFFNSETHRMIHSSEPRWPSSLQSEANDSTMPVTAALDMLHKLEPRNQIVINEMTKYDNVYSCSFWKFTYQPVCSYAASTHVCS